MRTLLPALALLTVAGCTTPNDPPRPAAVSSATPTPPALDGTQGYGDLQEVARDLSVRGIDCAGGVVKPDARVMFAAAQGRCDVGGSELVVQLWRSPVERDNRVSDLIMTLGDIPYCFILGRGNGAWSVSSSDFALCGRVGAALGGERFDSLPD